MLALERGGDVLGGIECCAELPYCFVADNRDSVVDKTESHVCKIGVA
jgi:hypothetical protein